MKTVVAILVLTLFAFESQAQSRTSLKGPKAKNYKHWKSDKKSATQLVVATSEQKQGPTKKNEKIWTRKEQNDYRLAVLSNTNRTRLKGPKAKNHKIWKKVQDDKLDLSKPTFTENR